MLRILMLLRCFRERMVKRKNGRDGKPATHYISKPTKNLDGISTSNDIVYEWISM